MIGVVVPAHNEETLLDACLESLQAAAGHPAVIGEGVRIVVVLDACSDGSYAVARQRGVTTLDVDFTNVGMSRHVGAQWLIGRGARWLAFTDADTIVQPDWLAQQLASRADAVCGGIRLEGWDQLPRELRRRFVAYRRALPDGRHIHGANLGVAVGAYQAVGGFAPLASQEDVHLVAALQQHGYTIDWRETLKVLTSTRQDARAPGGLGERLRALQL
ncbi:glycosyltransferase [Salinicola sp. V024]|uniref:glycosyltransferase n=1 Tax=Salinicola sp. V024 TaxID=3459609 RepID=UPI004043B2C1